MSRVALIAGLPISLESHAEVISRIEEVIVRKDPGHYISITNTESMYHGLRDPGHGNFIKGADFSLCDGVGVIVAARAWGSRIQRFNGPVLQLECSRYGVERGWRHYFYGGKEGVAQEMGRRLQEAYPGIIICGSHTPPFKALDAAERDAVVADIRAARPDIIWVGLGLLKQERWISDHLADCGAPWMVGVGAAFDYHAGAVAWAPPLLRRLGLEWLFRLILQPKLRAKRYWWSGVYVVRAVSAGLMRHLKLGGSVAA